MTQRRQPDYDFYVVPRTGFSRAQPPAPEGEGHPGVGRSPGVPDQRTEPQPPPQPAVNRFGIPIQECPEIPYGPPPGAPNGPVSGFGGPAPYGPPPGSGTPPGLVGAVATHGLPVHDAAPPGMPVPAWDAGARRRSPALALVIPMALVLVLLVAGGGWYLQTRGHDRRVWAGTDLTLPESVEGLPRITDPQVTAMMSRFNGMLGDAARGEYTTEMAIYSDQTSRVIVVVTARPEEPLSARDRAHERRSMEDALQRQGGTLVERDPGPLGGWAGCGEVMQASMCATVDPGALVVVFVMGIPEAATGDTAIKVRGQVEKRG